MDKNIIGEMLDTLGKVFTTLIVLCIIFVPLGLWKLIEIIIWIGNHMKTVSP
jgi:hypothetical protein